MKKTILTLAMFLIAGSAVAQEPVFPRSAAEDTKGYMSAEYWKIWNAEEQARIDADIEKYRKADGEIVLANIGRKRDVKIEQISHEFIFGAHIFNFNQLGKTEWNERYKRIYGELFNSATVPFYWKEFELEQGKPRFATEYRDTEEFWNNCKDPHSELHWRRPSTDQIVEFCESKGLRMHGHVLVWGNRKWHFPEWLQYENIPDAERAAIDTLDLQVFGSNAKPVDSYKNMTPEQIAATVPTYLANQEYYTDRRIRQIMKRYEGKIDSWDVVNEMVEEIVVHEIPVTLIVFMRETEIFVHIKCNDIAERDLS